MDPYLVLLACLGVIILAASWIPLLLRDLPLSLPIFCVIFGFLLFKLFTGDYLPNQIQHTVVTERVTELVVIIALFGAGLKIDRKVGWRRWAATWRLLAFGMPLSIAGVAALGWSLLEVSLAGAILLGAKSLAPQKGAIFRLIQLRVS